VDLARRSRIRASAPTLEIEIGLARRVAPGDVATSAKGRVSRTRRLRAAVRNCTRDEGGPFGFGDQEPISSHRKLLRAKAAVVLCQEGARAPCCTRDEGGPFGAVL
jgi:hypothetical protein